MGIHEFTNVFEAAVERLNPQPEACTTGIRGSLRHRREGGFFAREVLVTF